MNLPDPGFEATKSTARLNWMLGFEAIATVGNDEDSLSWRAPASLAPR